MLGNIVSVSTVCLALAFAGWKSPVEEDVDEIQGTSNSYDGTDQRSSEPELWTWAADESSTSGLAPVSCDYGWCGASCALCPQPIGGVLVDAIRNFLLYIMNFMQVLYEILQQPQCSNSCTIGVSLLTQILLILAQRLFRSTVKARSRTGLRYDWLTDEVKQAKERLRKCQEHEESMELMARTVEYVQRDECGVEYQEVLKVLKVTYPPMVRCECMGFDPHLQFQPEVIDVIEPAPASVSSSEDDLDLDLISDDEFVEPEYEWDTKYDFG